MKTNQLLILIFLAFLVFGCSSSNQGSASTPKSEKVYTNLVDLLREQPGLTVIGTGSNVTVRIRGNTSLVGNNEPLFVVNGTPVGNGYNSISSTLDVNSIESVRVRTRAQSGLYGSRGGNGVVEIKTKTGD